MNTLIRELVDYYTTLRWVCQVEHNIEQYILRTLHKHDALGRSNMLVMSPYRWEFWIDGNLSNSQVKHYCPEMYLYLQALIKNTKL